jgi:hypothetical protein
MSGFLELLLDENLCAGDVTIPKAWVVRAGGVNKRLFAKRKYELLLRILYLREQGKLEEDGGETVTLSDEEEMPEAAESLKADCYIAAKYSEVLRENGYFDAAVESILAQASAGDLTEQIVPYLEEMMGRGESFDRIEEATSPVLIYLGSDVCNDLLNIFARQFGEVLKKQGKRVIYFDAARDPLDVLASYIGKTFQLIFGVQTYLFGMKLSDGVTYLHERIKGPKYHLVLDHPIWLKDQLAIDLPDYHILTHDRNYACFIEKAYGKDAIRFPIPGMEGDYRGAKTYDFTFVGSVGDYRTGLAEIAQMTRPDRFLANRFLLVMRHHTGLSAEQAFLRAFDPYREIYSSENPVDVFYRMRKVIYVVMDYYRFRFLKTILDGGIRIDVFGDFWRDSILGEHPNLICHPGVSVAESLIVYAKSRMSLNVMSWHKDGYTERVANIMLARTVLVTDRTTSLAREYRDGEELLFFDIAHPELLIEKVKKLLLDPTRMEQIATAGYEKTKKSHTWEQAVGELTKDF